MPGAENFAAFMGVGTIKLICFGDSNTYGYDPCSYLGGRCAGDSRWVDIIRSKTSWAVENRGENGREIPRGPHPFPPDADMLIIMLGTNDLLQGRVPRTVASDMERFIQTIALARDKILLIAPPPMVWGQWVQSAELIRASFDLAQAYKELAGRLGLRFADAGQWRIELAYDGVHFTAQGHQAFAAGLLKEICL